MTQKSEVYEEFTKAVIRVRDQAIQQSYWDIDGKAKAPAIKKFDPIFATFDESQKLLIKILLAGAIDTVMHDLMFYFEEYDNVKIMLEENGEMKNLKEYARDGLQGHLFGWIEDHSEIGLVDIDS